MQTISLWRECDCDAMASQMDLFGLEEESQEIVNVGEDADEDEDEEENTIEGILIQDRVANDYDKKTKKTVAWQEGELSIIIDYMDDHYDKLVGHTKGPDYRKMRVKTWKSLLAAINNWNDLNNTKLIRSVKSIRTKIRNLRQRSE